jgi:hypothetical protein
MKKEQFEDNIFPEPNTGCWLWAGIDDKFKGYGKWHARTPNQKFQLAHRYSYYLVNGDFDPKMCVLHKCDVPACVNPDHLYLGDQRQNNIDRDTRGRQRTKKGIEHKCCKLTEDQVRQIRKLYVPRIYPSRRLAREFGVSQRKIMHIIKNESWRHLLS